jgi:hypothetical protein
MGRYDLACQEWSQFDPTTTTKDWAKFKLHFKAADRDMRSQETTLTTSYRGAHTATSDATLLATTQATILVSELQLSQAMSQASLSSSSRGSNCSIATATTQISAITTPDTRTHAYCWTYGNTANMEHSSPTCQYPYEGYQLATTAINMMGGTNSIFVPRRHPNGPLPGR